MKYLDEKDMMVNFPLPDGSELYPALGMEKTTNPAGAEVV